MACLLVAGQFAGTAHLLLVRHAICPLDGELIHPSESEGVSGHDAHAHPRNEGLPTVAAAEGQDAHHGHEHCILAASRRDRATLEARVVELLTPPRTIVATLSVREAAAGARIALHRLAPKQSPPV